MKAVCIFFGINSYASDPHVSAGTNDPDSDLAAICDQNFVKQDVCPLPAL
jgi:hypothetical protein